MMKAMVFTLMLLCMFFMVSFIAAHENDRGQRDDPIPSAVDVPLPINGEGYHLASINADDQDTGVSLHVEFKGMANIDVTPGGDEPDEAPLNFGICYLGYSKRMTFTVENVGNGTLEIEGAIFDEESAYHINDEYLNITIESFDDPILVEVEFAPETEQNYEEIIYILTNDPRYPFRPDDDEHGYPVHVTGFGLRAPELVIDRNLVEVELGSGAEDIVNFPVRNEGESDLIFETEVVIISEADRDRDAARSLRGATAAPRRDPPVGSFAVFQDTRVFGWVDENVFERVDNLEYDSYRLAGALSEVDLYDYDALWVETGDQSQEFIQAWDHNLERFEEYIASGHAIFIEEGYNDNHSGPIIGGLNDIRNPQNGILAVGADENRLVERMGWRENRRFPGDNMLHSVYPIEDLRDIENSDDFQVIVVGDEDRAPGVVLYRYGSGWVVASGSPCGQQWENYNRDGEWGSCSEAMLEWLLELSRTRKWIDIDPPEGEIEPDDEMDLEIIFDATGLIEGEYEAEVYFFSNDPEHPEQVVDVVLTVIGRAALGGETDPSPTEWDGDQIAFQPVIVVDNNETRYTIRLVNMGSENLDIERVQIDNEDDFSLERGDDELTIQAFDRIWLDLVFHPGTAGERSAEIHFFTNAGNEDLEDGHFHYDLWGIGLNPADNRTDQTIALEEGWNLISLNITPVEELWLDDEGPDMERMLEAFIDEHDNQRLIMLKDERGDFIAPGWDHYCYDTWNLAEGYYALVSEALEASWLGTPIDPQTEIPIETGWNMIPYYPNYDLPVEAGDWYALASIIDHIIIVKDDDGNFLSPHWNFSSIEQMTAGEGYQIMVDEDVVLVYPEEPDEDAALLPDSRIHGRDDDWIAPVSTGNNMSVLVTSLSDYEINDNDRILAFRRDGRLVGVGTFKSGKCGLAVWGDDEHTPDAVDGLQPGESFDLKLWDADDDVLLNLNVEVVLQGGRLDYATDDFLVLEVKAETAPPKEYFLTGNYPNPFNAVTCLSYGIPEASQVTISVFDLKGRLVSILSSGERSVGRYTVVWDARDFTSGIYVIRMESGNFKSSRKVMLVK